MRSCLSVCVCVCVCVCLSTGVTLRTLRINQRTKPRVTAAKGLFYFFSFRGERFHFFYSLFIPFFFFFGYTICYIKSDSRCALGDDNYWNKIIHLLRLYIVYYISTFYMCFFFLSLIISHKKRTTLAQLASFTLLALLHDAFINIIIN